MKELSLWLLVEIPRSVEMMIGDYFKQALYQSVADSASLTYCDAPQTTSDHLARAAIVHSTVEEEMYREDIEEFDVKLYLWIILLLLLLCLVTE